MAESSREQAVEQIAAFLAFYIDGHDASWAFVSPEAEADYRHKAEALYDCAHGYEAEAVVHGESPASQRSRPPEADA